MVNLIDRDLSIFIYPYCAVDRLSNKIKSTWLANFVSLHRICRTDKAFLFWSDGTIKFDTHIKQSSIIVDHSSQICRKHKSLKPSLRRKNSYNFKNHMQFFKMNLV